jgi:hypothetical protein
MRALTVGRTASSSSAQRLAEAEDRERDVGDRPSFAKDRISRGWDVLEITARHPLYGDHHVTNFYAIVKYFLPHGPFQGPKEEFNPLWETDPEGKPRSHVNGLGGIVKWQGAWKWTWFGYPKVAAVFETGYARPFRYNTYRIEGGVRILNLPITIWGQSGYGSDLAQYYKKVKSRGIELEIGSF